jgi:hypothetical protein
MILGLSDKDQGKVKVEFLKKSENTPWDQEAFLKVVDLVGDSLSKVEVEEGM